MRFGDQKQMKYWGLGGWWIIIKKSSWQSIGERVIHFERVKKIHRQN